MLAPLQREGCVGGASGTPAATDGDRRACQNRPEKRQSRPREESLDEDTVSAERPQITTQATFSVVLGPPFAA